MGPPNPHPTGRRPDPRNSLRFAARLNFDFFDAEKGYVYVGTSNGAKKIAALGGWCDTQMSYLAYGFDGIFDWPIGKNALKTEVDYKHYDSGTSKGFATAGVPTVAPQNDYYVDAGFYIGAAKVQPFFKYESLNFEGPVQSLRNQTNVGGGFNYYVWSYNLKFSGGYQRVMLKVKPVTARIKDANRFVLQLQGSYF